MSEYSDPAGRRRFLKLVGGTVVLAPLAGLAACSGGGDSAPAGGAESKPAADEGTGSGAGADMAREAEQAAGSAQQATREAAEETAQSAGGSEASGGGRPKLSLDDPQAKSLGYVHDATNVDQSKYGRYEPGQACSNCALFQAKGDEQWAGCSIFPGKLVNAAGWCSAWAPKA